MSAPGYYLLVFAKPGYQTQRYVIDSAQTDATQPLGVTLVAGQGRLSGSVTGPQGAVGGGQVTITDGVNTLTTSTDSTSDVGSWRVDGLSTPSTYLVSVSKDGLGAESALVSLDAGGTSALALALRPGVAALTGLVQGADEDGAVTGLGGVAVTATSGEVTRSATTLTEGPVGRYTLPGLTPGLWTVTVAADGFQPQTQAVRIEAGQSFAVAGAVLVRSTASVTGTVKDLATRLGQEGAGVILTNPDHTYKTLTGVGGSFTVNGMAAGTYVLSADLFGYTTAYATVTLRAGARTTQDVTLRYLGSAGLPSTAQIRIAGLMDATSRGPLACADASGAPVECVVTIATDPGATTTYTDTFRNDDIGSQGYVVPSVPDPPPNPLALLQPGLHQVVVSVPGYESVRLPVQVPIGATATPTVTVTVPTLSLYPAPRLLGSITAVVGIPTGLVVRATEVGGSGAPAVSAPVDSAGNYAMVLPEHGTYSVEVVAPATSEYRSIAPIPISFGLGEVRRYDATIHRYGRIVVTVLAPDPVTGQLAARPGALVAVTAADGTPAVDVRGNPVGSVRSDATGVALVTLLGPGLYRVQVQGGSQAAVPTDGLPVADDQSPTITVVLTNAVTQVVGRVVSQVSLNPTGTTGNTGIQGAAVTISGTVGYHDSTPDVQTVTATTGGAGCFAITPTGAPPQPVGACGGVTGDAVQPLALVTNQASLSITADGYATLVVPGLTVDSTSLLTQVLTPKPSTFEGAVTFDPDRVSDPALPVPTISVVRPAVGAGRVSITADAAGNLTWVDSNYGVPGQAWPGVYQISASLPGYTTATATVTCGLAVTPTAGRCTLTPFALKRLGTLVVRAATGDASASTLLTGATFTLTGNGSLPVTQTAPAGSTEVTFGGVAPAASPPYVVRVQAAGYRFADTTTLSVSCTGGPSPTSVAVSSGGTTTCTIFLTKLGSITGTTYGVLAKAPATTPTQPAGNVTLVAKRCTLDGPDQATACADVAAEPSFSAVSAADGTYSITGTAASQGLVDGWWQVSSSAFGYETPTPTYVHVVGGVVVPAGPTDIKLRVLPVTLRVGVQNGSSNAPDDLVTDATVVLTDPEGGQVTQTVVETGTNLFVFTGLVPTTYSVQITGPKINLVNLQVTLVVGVPTQTVYVRTDLSASTVSGTVKAVQGANPATTALAGASVDLGLGTGADFAVSSDVDGNALHTTTDPGDGRVAGFFTFSGVPDGTFVVRVQHGGYVDYFGSVTVLHGQATASLDIVLTRVTHPVTVTVVSANGFSLAGIPVTLTPVDTNPVYAPQPLGASTDAVTAPATAWGTLFNDVPPGTWTIGIGLASGTNRHFGTLAPVSPTTGMTVVVSGEPSTTTPDPGTVARYRLTEGQLDLSVSTTAWPNETQPAPATVALTVTRSGASTPTYTDAAFPTRSATDTGVTSIWVPVGGYVVSATPPASSSPAWTTVTSDPAIDVPSSPDPADGGLRLVEQPSELTVTVTLDGKALTAPQAVLTLDPRDGQTVPTAYQGTVTTTKGSFTFTDLPPGAWNVSARVGVADPKAADVTLVAGKAGNNGNGVATPINVTTATLAVSVTRDGKPITAAATLTLTPQAGQGVPQRYQVDVSTSATGAYTFTGLPAGAWTVTATVGAVSSTPPTAVTLVDGKSGDGGDGKVVVIDVTG